MYLDQHSVIALEYHYYQNDCKYINMIQSNEHFDDGGTLIDEAGEKVSHLLGTEKYQENPLSVHPMSAFEKKDVTNYHEDGQDLLRHQKQLASPAYSKVGNDYMPLDRNAERIKGSMKNVIATMMSNRRANKNEDFKMVEPIVAIYKVKPMGHM